MSSPSHQRLPLQLSLASLLVLTAFSACGLAMFRLFGASSLPALLGLLGGSAGYLVTKHLGRYRVFHVLAGFGCAGIVGAGIFNQCVSEPHLLYGPGWGQRPLMVLSVIATGTIVWAVSLGGLHRASIKAKAVDEQNPVTD